MFADPVGPADRADPADPAGSAGPVGAGDPEGAGEPERAAGPGTPAPVAGPALARAALDAARAAGRAFSSRPRAPGDGQAPRRRRWSAPGPDPRDPQPLGRLVSRLVADRGWEKPTAEARVLGAWETLVGAEMAAKCRPVSLHDGELTLQAESTAWATQLRLLSPKLLARLIGELGPGVVTRIRVHGPTGPSWKRGRLSVRGRGPRDTYG